MCDGCGQIVCCCSVWYLVFSGIAFVIGIAFAVGALIFLFLVAALVWLVEEIADRFIFHMRSRA